RWTMRVIIMLGAVWRSIWLRMGSVAVTNPVSLLGPVLQLLVDGACVGWRLFVDSITVCSSLIEEQYVCFYRWRWCVAALCVEDADFAARSHARAAEATKAGYFDREIFPIKIAGENGSTQLLEHDEGIRYELDREKMRTLPPAFQNQMFEDMFPGQLHWTVTA